MRTVVVTGSTSGFGKAITEEFLKNGDRVIATGRSLTKRTEIFAEACRAYPKTLVEMDLDVTSIEQRQNFVLELTRQQITVDILVNNAGLGLFGAFEETSEEQIRQHLEVNFFGTVLCTQDLLPMLRTSRGLIFNLSSVFGFTGFPLTSIYSAAKHAVEGWSESLDLELRPHGVHVCLIEPGKFKTSFNDNTSWGNRRTSGNNSPYQVQTDNYRKLRQKNATQPPFRDPQEVALGIVRASHENPPPLRMTFGPDALGARILRALLPRELFRKAMGLVSRRIFEKGRF